MLGKHDSVLDLRSFSRLTLPTEILDVVKALVRTVRRAIFVVSVEFFSRSHSIKRDKIKQI